MTRAVVLVEGESDRNAVLSLARHQGRDLAAEGVEVIAMGGATNIDRHLGQLRGTEVHGLYDVGEERFVRRALERHGFGEALDHDRLVELGFHCCVEDLEDELVRALGVEAVESVIENEGERRAWERFGQMPHQRGRPARDQLRRFLGTRSGRKIQYGGLLADALDPAQVPPPMAALLAGLDR